jgi:hypothetical protein
MTQQIHLAATGAGHRPTPVAALDVISTTLRDVDAVAHAVARELSRLDALDVVIASHVTQAGVTPHYVITVAAAEVSANDLDHVLSQVRQGFEASCTLVDGGFDGPAELQDGLEAAAYAHGRRASGRVVVFPGDHLLVGTVTVGDVPALSAVDRVEMVTGEDVDPQTPLVTRDFLRPLWVAGDLVLHVLPAVGGTLVPFETPFPTPCCADHS